MACLVLLAFLSLLRVFDLLVLESLVRPRGEYVGVASVPSAGRLLLKGLNGLSFCGPVETNFNALVFQGCGECVDAVGVAVGCLGVEKREYMRSSATRSSQVRVFLTLKRRT
jgi:hypothetical protein